MFGLSGTCGLRAPPCKPSGTTLLGMQQSASDQVRTHEELERLESDLRVLSPVGIERAALEAIESAGLGPEWDAWRRRLFFEVEGRLALVAWRAEHQRHPPHVHKAERAAFGAALGLYARPHISHKQYATLVSAMNEALPWLLPERPPAPAPAS